MESFTFQSTINAPTEQVFQWHMKEGAFRRLAPPWQFIQILSDDISLQEGNEFTFKMKAFGLPFIWNAQIEEVTAPYKFIDVQKQGPFSSWRHEHHFDRLGPEETRMRDEVSYELPGGDLVKAMSTGYITRQFNRFFAFRHSVVSRDLAVLMELHALPNVVDVEGDDCFFTEQLRAFFSCSDAVNGEVKLFYKQDTDHKGVISVENIATPDKPSKEFSIFLVKDSSLLNMKLQSYHFAVGYRKLVDDCIYTFARELSSYISS